jgi:hypothetical protein
MRDFWSRLTPQPLPEPVTTEPLLELRMTLLAPRPAEAANEDVPPAPGAQAPVTPGE